MYLTSESINKKKLFFIYFPLYFGRLNENWKLCFCFSPFSFSLFITYHYMMLLSFKRSPKIRIQFLSVVHPNNENSELYAQRCACVYVRIKFVDCKPHIRFCDPLFQNIFLFHFISLNNCSIHFLPFPARLHSTFSAKWIVHCVLSPCIGPFANANNGPAMREHNRLGEDSCRRM